MQALPPRYNQRLQAFDPTLRMRWSNSGSCWLLEQQAQRQRLPERYRGMDPDTAIRLADGYVCIGQYDPALLPPVDRLVRYLNKQSIARLGLSPEQAANYVDARERAAKAEDDRKIKEHFRDKAKLAYEELSRLDGTTSLPHADAARSTRTQLEATP